MKTAPQLVEKHHVDFTWLFAWWVAFSGLFLTFDPALAREAAYQPAQLNGKIPLQLIGTLLFVAACGTPLALQDRLRVIGLCSMCVVMMVALYLAITLSVEAIDTGQGPIGAVNNIGLVIAYCLLFRYAASRRQAP